MELLRWLQLPSAAFWLSLVLLPSVSSLPLGMKYPVLCTLWVGLAVGLWPLILRLTKTGVKTVAVVFDANLERLQTNRYEDLTAAELVSMLEGATRLRVKGDEDRAERIMRASLDLEHFISVVPLDPAQVPTQTLQEIREQRDALVALIGRSIPLHMFAERVSDTTPEG